MALSPKYVSYNGTTLHDGVEKKDFEIGDRVRNLFTGRVSRIASSKMMQHRDGDIIVFTLSDESMWSEFEMNRCWERI